MHEVNQMPLDSNGIPPLAGLRVLQLGHDLASQMVGLALADLGADVIRSGLARTDPLAASLERGKRVACFTSATDAIARLASSADVVIGSDLASASVAAAFSETAVRLSLPAFPTDDPRFLNKPSDEGAVLAAAGVLAERGPSNRLRGLGPAIMPMPIASAYAAAFGTLGVVAGIFGRQQSGRGDAIEVSLFSALMEGFSYNHVKIANLPTRYMDPRNAIDASALPLPEIQIQALVDPMYRSFLCADDLWFYIATPPHKGLIERQLRLLGLWDELLADGLPTDDPYLSTDDWKDRDEGSVLAYPQLSPLWRERIRVGIANVIRTRPAAHWELQFAKHGLCGTRVQSSAAWLESVDASASGLAIQLNDPLVGLMMCPGPFMWADDVRAAAPREIVDGSHITWKNDPWPIPLPGPRKPFLSGTRVLDLCNVIAGPTVAGCLTRFGAEVIKIDPTVQNFDPSITVLLSLQSARGKKSMLLDLASEDGRGLFAKMSKTADLVTFNGTKEQINALGLDIHRLTDLNKSIVLAQVSAFSGPVASRNDNRKGVDELLQAATGIMHRLKPDAGPPEEYAHYGTIDVATGVWGAVAAVAGMISARRTGRGRHVGTSLAAGAAVVQMPFLWNTQSVGPAPDSTGAVHTKADVAGRIDGNDYVAPDGRREPLARYADLRTRLALSGPGDYNSLGFVCHLGHPAGSPVELVTQCAIRCTNAPLLRLGDPVKYGHDTREIVKRLGLGEHDIERLFDAGTIADRWPNHMNFLPD